MGFLSCNSPVNHSCFGINSFNVRLLEVSTATVDRQTGSDRRRQECVYLASGSDREHRTWIGPALACCYVAHAC